MCMLWPRAVTIGAVTGGVTVGAVTVGATTVGAVTVGAVTVRAVTVRAAGCWLLAGSDPALSSSVMTPCTYIPHRTPHTHTRTRTPHSAHHTQTLSLSHPHLDRSIFDVIAEALLSVLHHGAAVDVGDVGCPELGAVGKPALEVHRDLA